MIYGEEAGGTEHIILVDSDGKVITSGLSTVENMNVNKWGGTAVTGRDVSPDLQVLTDLKKGAQNADGESVETANVLKVLAVSMLYNGATLDRRRNNVAEEILASAARTATTNSPIQTNYNHKGVLVTIDVTAIVDTPSVVPKIQFIDSVIDSAEWTIITGAAIEATGKRGYIIYPGLSGAPASMDGYDDIPMARSWRISMEHADADSITYQVAAYYLD